MGENKTQQAHGSLGAKADHRWYEGERGPGGGKLSQMKPSTNKVN